MNEREIGEIFAGAGELACTSGLSCIEGNVK